VPLNWDNDFIAFSRTSRRGVFVLLAIFLCVAIIPRFISEVIWEKPKVQFAGTEQDGTVEKEVVIIIDHITQFNPNELSMEEWMTFGLSEKQAQSVINFKEKIGGFKNKETVKKAYGISEEVFAMIADKMIFEKNQGKYFSSSIQGEKNRAELVSENDTIAKIEEVITKVELNSASFEELLSINGIGNYFAERIVDLRIAKGGFVAPEELLEIPYFKEANLNQIAPFIAVDKSAIRKMNINEVSLKQLSRHPEITWDMAKSIIDLRNDLGGFIALDQLLLSAHIDLRRFKKLENYLTIEE
jgi:competence protein ComEA